MTNVAEAGHRFAVPRRDRFRRKQAGGAVERGLHVLGLRCAAVSRMVVCTCAGTLALVASGFADLALAGAVLAFWCWNTAYALALPRGAGMWLLYVDFAISAAMCATQPWTVSIASLHNGTSWALVVLSIVIVACQWHTGLGAGMAAAVLLTSVYMLGFALADPAHWPAALSNVWLVAEGALSRGLFALVRRGARTADELIAHRERARRAASVAAARRADEREYLSALHDTAATTLLLLGAGVVEGRQPWLAAQAARDAAILRGEQDSVTGGEVDLVVLLADVAARSQLREVRSSLPSELVLPRAPGLAIRGAVTEALTNAARHSGCTVASLVASETAGQVCVEVADEGRGFAPGSVTPECHGLSLSIIERMQRAGGRAVVTSEQGWGTRVRVEWSRG
ncbi:sensor histidine kinase [Amycolatopsis sp. NPDC059021]|uniref:sensor histidine kinase n=1 Tax=Amycolatopsis sp. NPDC059021 TaxID=3346704 RepID=UPI003670B67C